ncbi:MAG: hypothetical protein WA783_11965 [Phormidesmis sp.]
MGINAKNIDLVIPKARYVVAVFATGRWSALAIARPHSSHHLLLIVFNRYAFQHLFSRDSTAPS